MIYHQISQIIIILFIIFSLYFSLSKKYLALLLLFVLGVGLSGFSVYMGTLWFPYKIVSVFILLIVLIKKNSFKSSRYFRILLSVFGLSLFIALIVEPGYEQSNLPLLQRSHFRPFVQLFTYISIASIIPFVILNFKKETDLRFFLKRYNLIVEIVMIFAILQFILLSFGIDFMPILRPNLKDSVTAAFEYGGNVVTRLYGISGEPKTLSAFLFPYFFISLYNFYNRNYNKTYAYHIVMLFLSLFIIINAFSSAVLISLALGLILTTFIWFRSKIKFLVPLILLISSVQFLNPASFSLISGRDDLSISLYDVITERTVTRLSVEGNERIDYVAIRYVFDERPAALIAGLGMGMYPYYITSGGWYGIDPINSNWVVLFLDFGLIGLFVFMFFIYKSFKLRKIKSNRDNLLYNTALIGLFSSYVLGLGVSSYIYMVLFLSLTIVSHKILKKQNKLVTSNVTGIKQ